MECFLFPLLKSDCLLLLGLAPRRAPCLLHDQRAGAEAVEVFVRRLRGQKLVLGLPAEHLLPCAHVLRRRRRRTAEG